MNAEDRKRTLNSITVRCGYYDSIEGLFIMDQWGSLPEEGSDYRIQMQTFLDAQRRMLYVTPEADEIAAYYEEHPCGEDAIENAQVRIFLKNRHYFLRVPAELSREYEEKKAQAINAWRKARQEQDFSIFCPYMEQMFELRKQIALATEPDADPFVTLLDLDEAGLTMEQVDRELAALRDGTMEILQKIRNSGVEIDNSFLEKEQDPDVVLEVGKQMIREIGYEEEKGGFYEKVPHAFSTVLGPRDSRICVSKSGRFLLLYTILHECGHSMYSYSSDEKVAEAGLYGGVVGAFHESQSRFVENMIGRSREYIHHIYPLWVEKFPDYANIPEEDFYRAVNKVKPGPVRGSADEITYNLHIIIRYELERDWFAGKITAAQMRDAWNEKYEKYLGVRPENDCQGILQDMHWTGDWIAYFQSYAIGNIYDGQILEAILKDIPDMYDRINRGEFDRIAEWLEEHFWKFGRSRQEAEMMQEATGSMLDAKPFIRYLDQKYSRIYGWETE